MLDGDKPDELAPAWKALSDGTRRCILDLLHVRPMTTGAIAGSFEISRIAVMKHLAVLEGAGLVLSEKRGRERWHHLNFIPLRQIYERWLDPERGRWAEALVGLKRHAEGNVPMTAEKLQNQNTLAIDIAERIEIAASPTAVFAALTEEPGAWWGQPYLSNEATALALEAKTGGNFYERWGGDGGALLAQVTKFLPARRLELTGRLHFGVVLGVADFVLEAAGDKTIVGFTHKAVGALGDVSAGMIGSAWQDLLGRRLKSFVEKGERAGIDGSC